MSRQAIAAVLARDDLASGERLVALALASYADRENRAWPGAPAAAARAGLGRSRYLDARERLAARGLVVVDGRAGGRGRSTTVSLAFAEAGPWWEGEINVELFEAILGYSSARGPARLLLSTMAAVSDAEGAVRDLTTEQLSAAAGIADRTYRRARTSLLQSGELVLVNGVGGRGNTNVWIVRDPRSAGEVPARRDPVRVAPPPGARPLVADIGLPADGWSARDDPSLSRVGKGGHDRALEYGNRPILAGVSEAKGGHDRTVAPRNRPGVTGVSEPKGGQHRTLFELPAPETPAERAAETPAETPAPNARAGTEPKNPRTGKDPPDPPAGGSAPDSVLVEKSYVTEHGRRRRRRVRVNLTDIRRRIGLPSLDDRDDWQRIRMTLAGAVDESTFGIWLAPLELVAVDDRGVLVLGAPDATSGWLGKRFGRLLASAAELVGRELRIADELERVALGHNKERGPGAGAALEIKQKEVS